MTLDVGDTQTLTAVYFDDDGEPADPTTVTLTITEPDGTVVTPAIGGSSPTGHYEWDLVLDQAGAWRYTWTSTGPGQVESGALVVGGPSDGPASWISADDVFSGTTCSTITDAERDHVLAARAASISSYVLWALSGRQYPGVFTDTVRPCRQSYVSDGAWSDRFDAGWWPSSRPWGVCGCGAEDECGCGGMSQVRLPGGPAILGIFRVTVDGDLLDPSAYRVDDHRRLVRLDGDRWPCCQDLVLADTEDGTWSVEYAFGKDPPEAGKQAARDLACELYRGSTGGDCALPKRVSTITRQNVSMTILDPFTFFDKGKTGIYSVDLFLAAVNPKGNQRPTLIMSPDVPSSFGTRTGP